MSSTDLHLLTLVNREDPNPNNLHLLTEVFKHAEVVILPPTISRGGGGGSSIVIPEALVVSEIIIKIKHIPRFARQFHIKTRHVELFEKLPIKIRYVVLKLSATVLGMTVNSLVQGLSLKMTNVGIDIDDSQS